MIEERRKIMVKKTISSVCSRIIKGNNRNGDKTLLLEHMKSFDTYELFLSSFSDGKFNPDKRIIIPYSEWPDRRKKVLFW